MSTKLQVFDKEGNVVGEAELNKDGTTKVSIHDLEPDTTYPKGTFKVSHVENNAQSELIDVPEFKTKPSKSKSKAQ